jgi:hypothetical protein
MSAFSLLGWLDCFDLAASLPKHMGEFKGEGRRLLYSFDAVEGWVEFESIRDALDSTAHRLGYEINRCILELLDPGHCSPWRTFGALLRTHLVLRTNPRAVIYSGIESMSPGQGLLVAFDPRQPFSAVNLGDSPRIHLVVDWRLKRTEDPAQTHAPVA